MEIWFWTNPNNIWKSNYLKTSNPVFMLIHKFLDLCGRLWSFLRSHQFIDADHPPYPVIHWVWFRSWNRASLTASKIKFRTFYYSWSSKKTPHQPSWNSTSVMGPWGLFDLYVYSRNILFYSAGSIMTDSLRIISYKLYDIIYFCQYDMVYIIWGVKQNMQL